MTHNFRQIAEQVVRSVECDSTALTGEWLGHCDKDILLSRLATALQEAYEMGLADAHKEQTLGEAMFDLLNPINAHDNRRSGQK